jgi:hypothetical protein
LKGIVGTFDKQVPSHLHFLASQERLDIARNEVTIGKLQKSVKQVQQRYQTVMRKKDSEISKLKIEVDNQRG